jgi:hypothetical protein
MSETAEVRDVQRRVLVQLLREDHHAKWGYRELARELGVPAELLGLATYLLTAAGCLSVEAEEGLIFATEAVRHVGKLGWRGHDQL